MQNINDVLENTIHGKLPMQLDMFETVDSLPTVKFETFKKKVEQYSKYNLSLVLACLDIYQMKYMYKDSSFIINIEDQETLRLIRYVQVIAKATINRDIFAQRVFYFLGQLIKHELLTVREKTV